MTYPFAVLAVDDATNFQVQQWASFGSGLVLVVAILFIALFKPHPTPFQYNIFRTILALACAAFAAFIPGLLQVDLGVGVKAAGAMAIFVVAYFYAPAALGVEKPNGEGQRIAQQLTEKYGHWNSPEQLLPLLVNTLVHPEGPRANSCVEQANLWLQGGNFDEAIKECDLALSLIPDLPIAQFLKAQALGSLDRRSEAVEEMAQVIKAVPNYAPARLSRVCWNLEGSNFSDCCDDAHALQRLGEGFPLKILQAKGFCKKD